jgi:ferredoxin
MCNNNGHCRKFDAGTMCPSYRATLDEQHLTRGRANTLRLALSGALGPDALASEAVHAALDLCVSCKGCRRECPTGVDMVKMKIEFLHHWQRAHGLPLRDRLIARLPRWAPWAARVPWLVNLRNSMPGAALLSEKLLGFSAKRSLPAWRSDTFLRDGGSLDNATTQDADVVLFVNTFTNYFSPRMLMRRWLYCAPRAIVCKSRVRRPTTPRHRDHCVAGGRSRFRTGRRRQIRARRGGGIGAARCARCRDRLEPSCLCRCATSFWSWASVTLRGGCRKPS